MTCRTLLLREPSEASNPSTEQPSPLQMLVVQPSGEETTLEMSRSIPKAQRMGGMLFLRFVCSPASNSPPPPLLAAKLYQGERYINDPDLGACRPGR